MQIKEILLIGGSGFIGRHLAEIFCAKGINVTVATRQRERAKHLLFLPTVDVVQADVHNDRCLHQLTRGKNVVVNLAGILHSRSGTPYGADFKQAHVELAGRVAQACVTQGVERLVHLSALNADSNGPSQYLRSKADGEAAILEYAHTLKCTLFRPSVVFGPEDRFLNLFAKLAQTFPILPLGCAQARFQPVYVEDVVCAIWEALQRPKSAGQTYSLCGPKVYTLEELVNFVIQTISAKSLVFPIGKTLASIQAKLLSLLPQKLLTPDNLDSMQVDAICHDCSPLPFDLIPTSLESTAPLYLRDLIGHPHYYRYRERAHR